MGSGEVSEATQRSDRAARYTPWLERFVLAVVWLYVVVTAIFPYLYGTFVAALLALALVACLVARLPVPRPLLWVPALVGVGLMGLLVGLARDNPGVRATTTVYIIEPLVLGLLFGLAWQFRGWRRTVTAALDSALIGTVILGCALYAATRLGTTLPAALVDPTYSFADTTESTLRTNFQGFNALVFLAPYACLRVFLARNSSWLWRCVLMTSALAGVLLAGRRILYLTVPFIVIVAILTLCVLGRRWAQDAPTGRDFGRFAAVLGVGLIATGIITTIVAVPPLEAITRTAAQFSNTVATTTSRGADSTGESDVRAAQSGSFLQAWERSPIWGHGSGAVAPGEVRNPDTPWTYELTYHLILYSFGILGSAVLLAWTLWMAWRLGRRLQVGGDALVAAVVAGWVGALLASVLDPYLLKLDGMWMVFIPFSLAVAAASRLDRPERGQVANREHA